MGSKNMSAEDWRALYKHHYLEILLESDQADVYLMRERPDTMMQSTAVIFVSSPSMIIVGGDLCPGRQTSGVMAQGCSKRWFTHQQYNRDYLAEKFLSKIYSPEQARLDYIEMVRDLAATGRDGDPEYTTQALILHRLRVTAGGWMFDDQHELITTIAHELTRCKIAGWDYEQFGWLGWGYPKRDFYLLGAIQHRFYELFRQRGAGQQ